MYLDHETVLASRSERQVFFISEVWSVPNSMHHGASKAVHLLRSLDSGESLLQNLRSDGYVHLLNYFWPHPLHNGSSTKVENWFQISD